MRDAMQPHRVPGWRARRGYSLARTGTALLPVLFVLAWALGALAAGATGASTVSSAYGHGSVAPTSDVIPSGLTSTNPISSSVVYTYYFPVLAKSSPARVDPNDPDYASQWALQTVSAPQAWARARGDGIVVAAVDSGVQLTHPDLAPVLWRNAAEIPGNGHDDDGNGYVDDVDGWDFEDMDAVPDDEEGHGTHVAGTIGAVTDNGIGVSGMGWGVTVMAVRVLDEYGEGDIYDVSEGIRYAADNGAHVINLSLGGTSIPAGTIDAAIAYAQDKGVLVIAATGNQGWSLPFYPAAYAGVLGVGATDSLDRRASFSNYGWYVDVAAPGVSLISTVPTDAYGWKSGTSMATPMVSGLAALVWSGAPEAPWSQVAEAIMSGADDLGASGRDDYYGWGRINAVGALDAFEGSGSASHEGQAPLPAGEAPAANEEWTSAGLREPAFRPGEVIVSLSGRGAQELGGEEVAMMRASSQPGVYLMRVPPGQELAYAERLRTHTGVVYAYPNYVVAKAVR